MSVSDQTFLELCQTMAREVGIPGTGPAAVTGQDGEHEKIVRYIRQADLDIKRRFIDWEFLWRDDFSVSVTAGVSAIDSGTSGWPANLGIWNPDEFYLDHGTDDVVPLSTYPYSKYRREMAASSQQQSTPGFVVIKPDNTLALWPESDGAYTLTGEYWKAPVVMTADGDLSDVPKEFRRLIVVRAKIIYAEHEDAPEVAQGAGVEHDDLLDQLIARYGPGQGVKRLLSAPESQQIVVVPQ